MLLRIALREKGLRRAKGCALWNPNMEPGDRGASACSQTIMQLSFCGIRNSREAKRRERESRGEGRQHGVEAGMRPKKSPASGKPDAGRKRQGPQALLHYSSVCAGASAGFSTSGAGVAAALGASALAAATASLVSSMMAMGAQSPARGRPSLTTRV